MKPKRNSRTAGTVTAAKKCENDTTHNSRFKFNTKARKMQVFVFGVVMVLVLATLIQLSGKGEKQYIPVTHTVSKGDTLWSIAQEYKPYDVTMQEYMAWVYEHNDCDYIYPGQKVIMAKEIKNEY